MAIGNLTGIQNYFNLLINPQQTQSNYSNGYQTSFFSQPSTNSYYQPTSYGYGYGQQNPFGMMQSLFSMFMNPFFMMMLSNAMIQTQNTAVINNEFNSINTDDSGDISKNEFTSYLQENFGLKANANDSLIDEVIAEISTEMPEDNIITRDEFIKYIDTNEDGAFAQTEIDAFKEKMEQKSIDINNTTEFLKINADSDENITKTELSTYLKENFGLNANENLTNYMLDDLTDKISLDENNEINKDEFMAYIDDNSDGILSQSEIDKFNQELQSKVTTLNNGEEWQADGGNGQIDWNQDGVFHNEGNHYDSYITYHAYDSNFSYFGEAYNVSSLESLIGENDNTSKDTDSRDDFVSNGTETFHKLSDTKYGFTVSNSSQRTKATTDDGIQINSLYDYVIWDKEKSSYIIGIDSNGDGNLTNSEITGIVNNVGSSSKTASPLTFDLNGDDKVGTTGIEKEFDLNGDGKVDQTAWAAAGDGVLAFDADGDGKVGEDGKELFGNNTDIDGDGKVDGHKNGFDALKALAEKFLGEEATVDGKLDAKEIKALEEQANLTMLVDDAQKSLTELGITELSLGYEESDLVDENGNEHRQVGEGFVMNGEKAKVDDVWFKYIQGE